MELGKACRVERAQVAGKSEARGSEPRKPLKTRVELRGLVFLGWRVDC